jgi:signal transduction histidine kinase
MGLLQSEGFRAHHEVTIRRDGQETLGWLTILFRKIHEPSPREIRLAEICAATAALFIDRANQQEKARRSEQQLHIALNSSAIPFAILSPVTDARASTEDFVLAYINDAGATALRSNALALTDKRVSEVLVGWMQGDIYCTLRNVMTSGQPKAFESLVETNACQGWFQIVATPFQRNMAVWFADISERKRQEQQLREADRQKDEFLATLAHELRNPLAPIRQAVSLLETGHISQEQRRWSQDIIKRQVTHMGMLLDDLLDVSRITRGKIELRKQPTPLASVIRAAVDTTKPLYEAKQHALTVELPADFIALNVDPLRLEQILINLLSNAAKYTPQGGKVTVTKALHGNEVSIKVSDNGIGIEPEVLPSLFEMFVQVPKSSEETNSGLGIGLALAQSLAQLHDGTLTVASDGPGKGASFTLSLPYDETLKVPETIIPEASVSTAAPRRILVVDDNPDIAETMAELLRLEDHEVSLAYNGYQALELFKATTPDVVLLDVGMPGMTGHQVAQAIRALPEGKHTLLIAITGWGQTQDKEKALQAGFDYHFTKPVSIADIYALL